MLDEPTNHLDLESREALEAALEAFPGTLLLVSHDRAVLDAVPDRIVAVEDLTLRSYDGGWADLVRDAGQESAQTPAPDDAAAKRAETPRAGATPKGRASSSRSRSGSRQLEPHVAELETRLAEDWTNMDLLAAYTTSREELDGLLARWEVLFAEAQVAVE